MDNTESRTIADVFNILDCWRHLPAFRLELQVAPFFALFLRDILTKTLRVELHPIVIPEFPLKIGTLRKSARCQNEPCPINKSKASNDQSYNVDYLVFSKDLTIAYLIELKTDMDSVNREQQCYLHRAKSTGIDELICGVIQISKKPENRRRTKYVHLLHRLAALELFSIQDAEKLYDKTFPKPKKGWSEAFRFDPADPVKTQTCEVVYLQPSQPDETQRVQSFRYVDFNDVADVVQGHGELGVLFANYLRAWTEPAGERSPAKIAHYR